MNRLHTTHERWLAGLFLCLLLGVFASLLFQRINRSATAVPVVHTPEITVSIQGSVRNPGTYALPFGARASDLLERAGGFSVGAAEALFRPVAVLRDGEHVFVPALQTGPGITRVSLNSATAAQLEALPSVGPVMAERIIAARPFHRVEDLLNVSGIGEKTFERIAPSVGL